MIGDILKAKEAAIAEAFDAVMPGTLFDLNRCELVSHAHAPEKGETLYLDGLPLVWFGPLEVEQTAEGERYVIRYKQSIRRLWEVIQFR